MTQQLERQVKIFEILAKVPTGDDGDDIDSHTLQRIRPPLDPEGDLITLLEKLRPEASPGGGESPDTALLQGRHSFMMHSRVHRASGPNAVDVFVLSRVRLGEGGLPIINRRTGQYREMALADEEGFAEETHIAFFPNNILAVVSNGQGAPGPVRIEEYLGQRIDWQGAQIQVAALVPPKRLQALQRDNLYTRAARVRLPASTHSLLPPGNPFYRDVARMAAERYGSGVEVDLTVKVPTRGEQAAADRLFEDFVRAAESGQAKSLELTYQDRETERGRAVNLLHDILAYTTPVTVKKETGDEAVRVFSEWSTSRALKAAYDALKEDIQAALAAS